MMQRKHRPVNWKGLLNTCPPVLSSQTIILDEEEVRGMNGLLGELLDDGQVAEAVKISKTVNYHCLSVDIVTVSIVWIITML